MLEDGIYYPSDGDRLVFKRIISAVRQNPAWFMPPAAALDRDYSTQAIRDRIADELREHRANPNHNSQSRTFQRKHLDHKAVPSPPKRIIGEDGKPSQPTFPLRGRFARAFHDTFEDDTALHVLEVQERIATAARRVLLAWLRLDPDRGSIKRITEFQKLRTRPTENGMGPLWIPDDTDMPASGESLFIRRDGGIQLNATTWIGKAKEATDCLEFYADVTSRTDSNDTADSGQEVNDPTQSNIADQRDDGKAVPLSGMTWQNAMKLAEEHVKAHDGAFPSIKRLAEIVRCSRPTMTKAIGKSSYLKARKAEKSQSARIEPLTDISIEQISEQAYRDDAAEQPSRDTELDKLIAEQNADEARDVRQEMAAKKRRP